MQHCRHVACIYTLRPLPWKPRDLQFARKLQSLSSAVVRPLSEQGVTSRVDKEASLEASKVLHGRRMLLQQTTPDCFHAAGVSFNNRQEVLSRTFEGQTVEMVCEPTNPYDPNAILINNLKGEDLGYVPRELTSQFPHYVTYGHVYSKGESQNKLLGIKLICRPLLAPLTLTLPPKRFCSHIGTLHTYLAPHSWEQLQQKLLEAANNRCQLSGVASDDLQFCEWWWCDEYTASCKLLGYQVMHPHIAAVKQFEKKPDEKNKALAKTMLHLINGFSKVEADRYIEAAIKGQGSRSRSQFYRLDCGWLREQGLEVTRKLPDQLY